MFLLSLIIMLSGEGVSINFVIVIIILTNIVLSFMTMTMTEMASEEGGSMPDISGDRSLRDRDYNPEQVKHHHNR